MNTIKRGAIFGLIALILLTGYSIILSYQTAIYYTNQVSYDYSNLTITSLNLILLIGGIGIFFFYLAFLKLGERYKNKLLRVMSLIFVVISIINIFLMIISTTLTAIELVRAEDASSTLDPYLVLIILITLIFVVLVSAALIILFGIGIKKLGKEVKYSKITGILYIISGATMIIFIGFILVLVANFFAVALLWNEGKKQGKKIKK
jgi:uncharacterized membrane protein